MTTPSRGVGVSPVGSAAYGYGTPAVVPTPGGAVYVGDSGVRYGSRKLSRSIGSVGQYEYDSFGRAKGQPDVEHLVTIAALMILDSSAVQGLGQQFFDVRYVTPNIQQEMESRVNAAFASLVGQGIIRIDSITVEPNAGIPTVTHVLMTDLTTGLPLDELTVSS